MAILFLVLSAIALVAAEKKSYANYKLVGVMTRDEADVAVVREIEEHGGNLWASRLLKGGAVSILLSPEQQQSVFELLSARGMTYWIMNENIQEAIDQEHEMNEQLKQEGRIVGTFARYADIETWLKQAATRCGNNCVLETNGKSYEGRQHYVFRFGRNIKTGAVLPRIFSESSLHAREWLAQAAHIWIIDQLILTFGTDTETTNAFSKYELDLMVVGNPDGYEYSQTNDRMWRKTRAVNSGSVCRGVDPNRNFDYHWCGEGTSNSPCSDTYCGPRPFSEVEANNVATYVNRYKSSIKAYIAQHTYCQMILIPYGYTTGAYPPDYNEILRVGNAMATAMRAATGKIYTVGNSADLLYPAAGASDDWAKGVAGIKYAYTIELRPTCNTNNGFIVNPSEIAPAGNELLEALISTTNTMV